MIKACKKVKVFVGPQPVNEYNDPVYKRANGLLKPWEHAKIILTDKQVTSARNIITIYVTAVLPAVTRNYAANLGLLVLSSSGRRKKRAPMALLQFKRVNH